MDRRTHTSHNRRHDDDANKSLEMATMEDIAIRRMNNLVLLHLVLERDRNEESSSGRRHRHPLIISAPHFE